MPKRTDAEYAAMADEFETEPITPAGPIELGRSDPPRSTSTATQPDPRPMAFATADRSRVSRCPRNTGGFT
jgi:hypothetical protein